MAGFSQAASASKKPARCLIVPPTAFKDTWRDRPIDDIAIGIRVPGDAEVSASRAEAARIAWEYHPRESDDTRVDCYNDALFREICALGMCDANDVTAPYFPNPEDDVRTKLTSEGAKYIYDAIEQAVIETSPVHREATDEDVAALGELLTLGGIDPNMPDFQAKRVRRLIAFMLDEMMGEV